VLGRLVEWGDLRVDPDTSRVTTVEDFHRARFLYQLTHAGEAAERALGVYEEQLGKRGAYRLSLWPTSPPSCVLCASWPARPIPIPRAWAYCCAPVRSGKEQLFVALV